MNKNQKGFVHLQVITLVLVVMLIIGLTSWRVIARQRSIEFPNQTSATTNKQSTPTDETYEAARDEIQDSNVSNPVTTQTSSPTQPTSKPTQPTSPQPAQITPTPNPYITNNGTLTVNPSHVSLEGNSDGAGYYISVNASNGKSLSKVWVVSAPTELHVICCSLSYGFSGSVWQKSNTTAGSGTVRIAGSDTTGGTYSGSFTVSWSALTLSNYGY